MRLNNVPEESRIRLLGLDAVLGEVLDRREKPKPIACAKCGQEQPAPIDVEGIVGLVESAEQMARDLDLPNASAGMRHMMTSVKAMVENEKAGDRPDPLALLKVSTRQH